jgi:hypothetical protein
MNVFTRFAAAGLVAAAFGSAASAEEWTGPRVVGTGENASLEYAVPSTNIVGGALVRVTGAGEGASVETLSVDATQPGRIARVVGSGENMSITYDAAPRS